MKSTEVRRILITGATRGIGRETALQLASPEVELVLLARDSEALERVAAQVRVRGGRAQVVPVDLRKEAEVRREITKLLEFGPIDVLVNNAGICHQRRFLHQALELIEEEWELNYFGVVNLTRIVLPHMLERGSGRIVNVSSLLGSCAAPTTANYAATKAALEAFSQGLRGELLQSGVSVEVFVAPHTQTEQGRRVVMDGVVSLPVEYVAGRLVAALRGGGERSYGSPVYRIFDFLARLFPRFFEKQMRKAARTALASSVAQVGSV